MSVKEAEELIAKWRTDADEDNPAGPLFASGDFSESDIAGVATLICGTVCSASLTRQCC